MENLNPTLQDVWGISAMNPFTFFKSAARDSQGSYLPIIVHTNDS